MLVRSCLRAMPQLYVNQELPDVQTGFRKGRGRSNCQHLLAYRESKGISEKNIYLCFINYTKAFDCVDHDKLWKALREMEMPDYLVCLLRTCMWVKKQQWEPCMEQLIVSRSRNEYNRAVCCHPVCLIYTLSTSWEILGGWVTSQNQDRWEKQQQPQICGWCHSNANWA